MFSSNQILDISGTFEQLEAALELALKIHGTNPDKDHLVWQATDDGRFVIGRIYNDKEEGWNEFQIDFTTEFAAKAIAKHVMSIPHEPYDQDDGGFVKTGFRMKAFPETVLDKVRNGVKSPSYAIVEFSQYALFYSQ